MHYLSSDYNVGYRQIVVAKPDGYQRNWICHILHAVMMFLVRPCSFFFGSNLIF